MTETELELEVNTYRNEIHASFFLSEPQLDLCCQGYRDGLKKREVRIQELEEELKKEKELNMEIKNRFVKCNMCTEEIRTDNTDTFKNALNKIVELEEENGKLLQRIKQLEKDVIENESECSMCDFPKLKQDLEKQIKQAKEIIKFLINPQLLDKPEYYEWRLKAEQFLKEE